MKFAKLIASAFTTLGLQTAQAADLPPEVKVGDLAPNFTLTSNDGQPVSLSDYKGKNIVLIFSRAHWWPFCVKQLVKLQKNKAEFDKMNAQMLCVFREERKGIAGTNAAAKKSKFSPILLDTPTTKTTAYSQKEFATYLIDGEGIIKAKISGTKYVRPGESAILDKTKEVFKIAN